jgi:hypothetical protein
MMMMMVDVIIIIIILICSKVYSDSLRTEPFFKCSLTFISVLPNSFLPLLGLRYLQRFKMVLSWYVLEIVMALSIFKVSSEKHTAPIVRATTGQRGTFVQDCTTRKSCQC